MNISILVLVAVFFLIAVRQIGSARLKIWQIMLGGAVVVVLAGEISPVAAFHAIHFDVIFFLFGMFIIGQAAEDSGYVTHICHTFFKKVRSVDGLVLSILFTMGIGSAVLMNDTIAIIGTPDHAASVEKRHLCEVSFALPRFAVTLGSVMSPIGNPQNLLVAMGGEIRSPFVTFLRHLFLPTVLNLYLTYLLLKLFFKEEFDKTNLRTNRVDIKHFRLSQVARISLILVVVLILVKVALTFVNLFVKIDFDFNLTWIALIGCSPILIYRFMSKKKKYRFHILRKIDWFTLIFFASMVVLMESVWQSGFFQNLISSLSLNMTSILVIMIVSVVVSQLISNVPMVALLPLIVSPVPVKRIDGACGRFHHRGQSFILGGQATSSSSSMRRRESWTSITFLEFAKSASR